MIAVRPRAPRLALAAAFAALAVHDAGAQAGGAGPPEPRVVGVMPSIEVVGTTPLPGFGTPLAEVPGNVQVFTGRDIARQRATNLAEFLDANPSSVNVNSATGNPFQSDVNFRGFTASPLLGTPQGLSVFVDGVRINEPFGDVVNWDLIPTSAIASIQVIPGTNPIFGLNTLGGALAVYTKNGITDPGTRLDATAGAFGRRALAWETGGSRDAVDWFVTGNLFDEDGWREHSPSRVRQLFAKIRHLTDDTELGVSVSLADNTLDGTQALPVSMLDRPPQAYTWPDTTQNRLAFVNARALHAFDNVALVAANAYYRGLRSDGVNSNVNGDPDAPGAPPAFNVASAIDTRGGGASLQLTLTPDLAGHRNSLTVGVAADLGATGFRQSEQPAAITTDRETPAAGGYTKTTDVDTQSRHYGIYAIDTLSLYDRVAVTVSARYNAARIRIEDRSGETPALNGTHDYRRLNPAAGLTYEWTNSAMLYANWSEGMRVPSPVELTCADPAAPCTLPNIFVADPPLKPVIGTTIEAGARGRPMAAGRADSFWSVAVYRTELRDDIQFVSAGSGAANAGYFQNIGRTRRIGVELGAGVPLGPLTIAARYSYTRATFESGFRENSPNNSTAGADGAIDVRAGNRIPAIPAHVIKLRADWIPTTAFALGATLVAAGPQYARGDENNRDAGGRVPGYAVVGLDARYRIDAQWEVSGNVANLFGARYQNFGILGTNFFRGPGNTYAPDLAAPEGFRARGAPLGAWIGVRYAFGEGRAS